MTNLRLVRQESDTPNVLNTDDARMMRYALGGQNGYIIDRGMEVNPVVNGLNFTIQSGELVIDGWQVDVMTGGVTLTIDSISATRYYTVWLEINLANETAEIKLNYGMADYPTVDKGDDLTNIDTGTARMILYKFLVENNIVTNIIKVVEPIKYLKQYFDDAINIKQGSITLSDSVTAAEITELSLRRQVNFVIGTIAVLIFINNTQFTVNSIDIGIISDGFRPKQEKRFSLGNYSIIIYTDGLIRATGTNVPPSGDFVFSSSLTTPFVFAYEIGE